MNNMRMTDFPVLEEIREEYVQLRQQGSDRDGATRKLMESYKCELAEDMEDAVLFRIGLADAQYSRKELTEDAARKALEALDAMVKYGWHVAPSDLNLRREHYAQAPMPERKIGKPRPKFRCSWQLGDTFALKLTGQAAAGLGISGKYMLLRKIAESECAGAVYPVVTVSICEEEQIPKDKEAFCAIPLLKLQTGGRCFSPKDKFEYRTVIYTKSSKRLRMLPLRYCGNFPDLPLPDDEIIFNSFGETMITIADTLEDDLICYWKRHNSIETMTQYEK